jgi:hypothetical protein
MSVFYLLMIQVGRTQDKYTYTIKADSVKITNCDSAELILENHTQGVPGFLFNIGNGRTIFQRGAVSLGNGRYLVGSDTINLGANAWLQGGNAFGTTGILGTLDASPLDFYTSGIQGARLNTTGNLLLGTYADNGAKLQVVGSSYLKAGPNISFGLTTGSDNSGRSAVFGDSALTPADYAHHGLQINVFSSHAAVQSFSNVNQVLPTSLSLNETGGDVMINTTTDNGNTLQVNGTSWFNGTMNVTGTVNAPIGGNPANGLQVTPTLNATATSSILNGVLISPIFNTNGYGGVTSYGLNVVNGTPSLQTIYTSIATVIHPEFSRPTRSCINPMLTLASSTYLQIISPLPRYLPEPLSRSKVQALLCQHQC